MNSFVNFTRAKEATDMTLYTLKAYPTPHKMHDDACIIGCFTTKAALFKAIRKFKNLWHPCNKADFRRAIQSGAVYSLNGIMQTGSVEVTDANAYLVEPEEMTDFVDEGYFVDD